MALFKILKGKSQNLPKTITEGYAYVTTDEHKMYIDISDTERVCLNDNESVQNSIGSLCWTAGDNKVYEYTMSGTNIVLGEEVTTALKNCETDEYLGKWFLVLGGTKSNLITGGQTSYNKSQYTIDGANGQLNIRDYVVWAGRWVHINLYEAKPSTEGDANGYNASSGVDGLMSSTQAAHLSDLIEDLWHPRSGVVTYNSGNVTKPGLYTDIVSGRPETDKTNGLFIKNSSGALSQIIVSENNNNLWFRGSNSGNSSNTSWQKVACYNPTIFTDQVGFMPLHSSTEIFPNWADQGIHYGTLREGSKLNNSKYYHLISTGVKPTGDNDGNTGQIAIGVGNENTGIMQYRGKGGKDGGAIWNNVVHVPNDTYGIVKAVGSATRPVYITAQGVPVQCNNSLGVDISGTAKYANYATTQDAGTNNDTIATTKYVDTAVANLVNGAPDQLNTLKELADALGNNENLASEVTDKLGTLTTNVNNLQAADHEINNKLDSAQSNISYIKDNYLPLSGGTLTGSLALGDSEKYLTVPGPENIVLTNNGTYTQGYTYTVSSLKQSSVMASPISRQWFNRLAFLRTNYNNLNQMTISNVQYKDTFGGGWKDPTNDKITSEIGLIRYLFDGHTASQYVDTNNTGFLEKTNKDEENDIPVARLCYARTFEIADSQFSYSNIQWLKLKTAYAPAKYNNNGKTLPKIRITIDREKGVTANDITTWSWENVFEGEITAAIQSEQYVYIGTSLTSAMIRALRFTFELAEEVKNTDGEEIEFLYPLTEIEGLTYRQDNQALGPSIQQPFLWNQELEITMKKLTVQNGITANGTIYGIISPKNTSASGARWSDTTNYIVRTDVQGGTSIGNSLRFYGSKTANNYTTQLKVNGNASGNKVTLPTGTGTLALAEDIPNIKYTNTTPTPVTIGGISKGTKFNNVSIIDIIEQLLYPYVAPTITLVKGSSSSSVFELGTETSVTLTANVTKGSKDIDSIALYGNNKEIKTEWTTEQGEKTQTENIAETTKFIAKVQDNENTYSSSTITINGVDPFFYGTVSAAPSDTKTINDLTKDIAVKGNKTYTFTTKGTNNKYCICYPTTYDKLTSILDANGFENIDDFNVTEATRNRANGESEKYYVYTYQNAIVDGVTTTFTFKFS